MKVLGYNFITVVMLGHFELAKSEYVSEPSCFMKGNAEQSPHWILVTVVFICSEYMHLFFISTFPRTYKRAAKNLERARNFGIYVHLGGLMVD